MPKPSIPVIILIAGIIVLFDPFSSAEGVFILFGATLIFYGITDLVNQYAINKLRKSNDEKEKIQRMDGAQDVEDADYEEVKPEWSENQKKEKIQENAWQTVQNRI